VPDGGGKAVGRVSAASTHCPLPASRPAAGATVLRGDGEEAPAARVEHGPGVLPVRDPRSFQDIAPLVRRHSEHIVALLPECGLHLEVGHSLDYPVVRHQGDPGAHRHGGDRTVAAVGIGGPGVLRDLQVGAK